MEAEEAVLYVCVDENENKDWYEDGCGGVVGVDEDQDQDQENED